MGSSVPRALVHEVGVAPWWMQMSTGGAAMVRWAPEPQVQRHGVLSALSPLLHGMQQKIKVKGCKLACHHEDISSEQHKKQKI
ncbi:hypothetical protein GQ55_6G272100 [Panicum hallii var. hallii]|uniref:Uncharacterized protein n=1 Tax=Panicum hallii var. hallii TaxID=1504633 RepID=A0A2T7DA60_9POAL|nr:hypothetical protein GQ55_6G272100 [Panicum hallii var. hallii]